jgi:hypothetical protein
VEVLQSQGMTAWAQNFRAMQTAKKEKAKK